jgi:hypothetical protein
LLKHHLGLGLKRRFGKHIAVEDATDQPIEAIIPNHRLPRIVGSRHTHQSFEHVSQWLASATATDDGAQVVKQSFVDGFQSLQQLLSCTPERTQFARLRWVGQQSIDAVDDRERDGVDHLGAALKVVLRIEGNLVKRVELGLQ